MDLTGHKYGNITLAESVALILTGNCGVTRYYVYNFNSVVGMREVADIFNRSNLT
jgi:hypothetical protein